MAASRRYLVHAAARFVPELRANDTLPGPAGVRAQAVSRSGDLVDDFLLAEHDGMVRPQRAVARRDVVARAGRPDRRPRRTVPRAPADAGAGYRRSRGASETLHRADHGRGAAGRPSRAAAPRSSLRRARAGRTLEAALVLPSGENRYVAAPWPDGGGRATRTQVLPDTHPADERAATPPRGAAASPSP